MSVSVVLFEIHTERNNHKIKKSERKMDETADEIDL